MGSGGHAEDGESLGSPVDEVMSPPLLPQDLQRGWAKVPNIFFGCFAQIRPAGMLAFSTVLEIV